MPFRIGWPELLIILLIMMVLFGGRLTKSAGELAKGIKIFQKTMKEDEETKESSKTASVAEKIDTTDKPE